MPARKKAPIATSSAKPTKPPRAKPKALPATGDATIPGLTKELSTLVSTVMAKDADILEALREA